MTAEQQRIVIAKACPTVFRIHKHASGHDIYFLNNEVFILWTNDNDLNAMHEAEKVLTDEQWENYVARLKYIVHEEPVAYRYYIHATAVQRAGAFISVLKLHEA